MKRILITGYKGFIGAYLTKALKAKYGQEANVFGMDLKNGPKQDAVDYPFLEHAYDVIFHLAAQTKVDVSTLDPLGDARNNILATINVLKSNPQAKIIFTSSVAAKEPISPYGIAKLACEHYAHVIHSNTVVCRLPNVFAKDDHGVVNRFLTDPEIVIYGDGKQERDFVYVGDIVKGLMLAEDWDPGLYEFGSSKIPKTHTILELAQATEKKINFQDERPGDIKFSSAENTTPNWKPEVDIIKYITFADGRHENHGEL